MWFLFQEIRQPFFPKLKNFELSFEKSNSGKKHMYILSKNPIRGGFDENAKVDHA